MSVHSGGRGPGHTARSLRSYFLSTAGNTWFAEDVPTFPWYATATTPHAVYEPTSQTAWLAYEGWTGSAREGRIVTYNRQTGQWKGPYPTFTNPLVDDDHGAPAIVRDHQGYWHSFGGAHNSAIQSASTRYPDDPRFWVPRTLGLSGAYPHPSLVGSALYVFCRDGLVNLTLRKTTALSAGSPTWGSSIIVSNMDDGTGGRWYQGNHIVRGTDIHIIGTRADNDDTFRENVYYLIYDTTTGSVKNFDGSVTVASGSFPINLTTLNTSFRIFQHGVAKAGGGIPILCYIGSTPHVLFKDDDGATLKHFYYNGSAWTSPATIATVDNTGNLRYNCPALIALSDGRLVAYWPDDPGTLTRGGRKIRKSTWSGSAWSAASDVFSWERTYGLETPGRVDGAPDDMHLVFGENNVLSGSSATEAALRTYLFGSYGSVCRNSGYPDYTPDTVTFTDQTDVALSSTMTSNSVTLAGIDDPIFLSVSGGTYSKNGGAYTSADGTLSVGDTIALRHTSSASGSTTVTTTLTYGNKSATFSSTTLVVAQNPVDVMIARMSVAPSAGRQTAMHDLYDGLVADGVWSKLDCLWVLAAHDAQAAQLNWIAATEDLVETASAPTFTTDRGYTGDASAKWLTSTYNPSNGTRQYVQNSAHMYMYTPTAQSNTSVTDVTINVSQTGSQSVASLGANVSNQLGISANNTVTAGRSFGGASNSGGGKAWNRINSTQVEAYNGANVAAFALTSTISQNSSGVPNTTTQVCRGSRRLAAVSLGAKLTSTEMAALNSRITTYLTVLGAN